MSDSEALVLRRLEEMLVIRRFEEQLIRLHHDGEFPGHYHVYIGQESVAVAACEVLSSDDYLFSTWRNHGHLLARGADPGRMLAEILGKRDGYCRGKGGTLHLAVGELGIPVTSGLVGSSLPIATGTALALKKKKPGAVAVAFFGDAALEEGAFYEAINLAAIWRLPILYICENNSIPPELRRGGQYPSSTHSAKHLTDVPEAFQIPSEIADGADIEDVAHKCGRLIEEIREEQSPRFIEARFSRWPGNFGLWPEMLSGETDLDWIWGEAQPSGEIAGWTENSDPLVLYARKQIERGVLDRGDLVELDGQVRDRISQAARFAKESPYPQPTEAYEHVLAGERRQL